jgi:hypothetical protein
MFYRAFRSTARIVGRNVQCHQRALPKLLFYHGKTTRGYSSNTDLFPKEEEDDDSLVQRILPQHAVISAFDLFSIGGVFPVHSLALTAADLFKHYSGTQ